MQTVKFYRLARDGSVEVTLVRCWHGGNMRPSYRELTSGRRPHATVLQATRYMLKRGWSRKKPKPVNLTPKPAALAVNRALRGAA